MKLSAFDTYTLYLALRNHFARKSYDFFLYRGKVTASIDSFMKRNDRFQFQRLARKFDEAEMQAFLVANIIQGKSWVGEFLDEDADDNYKKFLKINQSLSYHFTNDLDKIFTKSAPSIAFKVKKNTYPTVFNAYISGSISIQTMVVLNDMVRYISKWNEVYQDDSIVPRHLIMIEKFAPFLEYDKTKLKTILKDKIKEYEHGEEQETCRTPISQRANVAQSA